MYKRNVKGKDTHTHLDIEMEQSMKTIFEQFLLKLEWIAVSSQQKYRFQKSTKELAAELKRVEARIAELRAKGVKETNSGEETSDYYY